MDQNSVRAVNRHARKARRQFKTIEWFWRQAVRSAQWRDLAEARARQRVCRYRLQRAEAARREQLRQLREAARELFRQSHEQNLEDLRVAMLAATRRLTRPA